MDLTTLSSRLDGVRDLDDDELSSFQNEMIGAFATFEDDGGAASLARVRALAASEDVLRAELDRRSAAVEAQQEAVTASGRGGGMVRQLAARRRAQASPEAHCGTDPHRAVLTATGNLKSGAAGAVISDRHVLADGLAQTLGRMQRNGPPRGDVIVASAKWEYPPERRLGADPWENSAKMDAVVGRDALTASGGICAPVNVDYTVPTWSAADRPLRDGLPAFQATRGGLIWVQPPSIGQWNPALENAAGQTVGGWTGWGGATGIWTEATDANPAGATKPLTSMSCGTQEQTFVEAISTRLGFGNMQGRFSPEQVAATVDVATCAAARISEINLLNLIAATAVADVTSSTLLGATRDLMTVLDEVTAGYRNLNRIPRSQSLTVIFPDWLKDLLRADLSREMAHQQGSDWNSLGVSDQQFEDLLAARGVNVIWHLDGQVANVPGGVSQLYAPQSPSSPVNPFPSKVVWYLFPEGMIQFLDGGELNLGVVRDASLDASNDYELFTETFEGIANRGFANGVYQMVTSLCANGSSASTVSTAGSCA